MTFQGVETQRLRTDLNRALKATKQTWFGGLITGQDALSDGLTGPRHVCLLRQLLAAILEQLVTYWAERLDC